jgi:hypothetical protein
MERSMWQPTTFEQVFRASIEAIGGITATDNITSIAATADCTSPRGGYITEIQSMRDDRLMFTQLWPEHPPLIAYLNGQYAWMHDPATGAVEVLDPISASIIRAHEFQILPIVMASRYCNIRLVGQKEIAGICCDVVGMSGELGQPCRAYFSRTSHLLVGMTLTDPRRGEQAEVQVIIDQWAMLEGVRLPSKVIASDTAGDFVLNFHTIRLNTVDPAIFAVPAEILDDAEYAVSEIEKGAHRDD